MAVFVGTLVSPPFRAVSYAPLRELFIPEPDPIVVEMVISTEKRAWLEDVQQDFAREEITINGRPIALEVTYAGSREMVLDVVNSASQPVVLSPASTLQASILESQSAARFGAPLVNAADRTQCTPTVSSPLVIVGWADRADTLWGDDPGPALWDNLHDALVNSQGWAAYGRSDWGFVKFGHTSPESSNSGLQTLLLLTYNYHDKTSNLTSGDVLSDVSYQQWITAFENAVNDFGNSTGTYMDDIVAFGPSRYDFVAVYESLAIEQAENAANRYGELRVYYPPATIVSSHPFCVLDAPWVSAEEAEAARAFIDYLLTPQAQELAMFTYGFRPSEASIPLEQPGSPFVTYTSNGIRLDLPPEVAIPEGDVINTLIDFWVRNIGS
jgi:ABC-type Fe3+ transport system substrate-binding protein